MTYPPRRKSLLPPVDELRVQMDGNTLIVQNLRHGWFVELETYSLSKSSDRGVRGKREALAKDPLLGPFVRERLSSLAPRDTLRVEVLEAALAGVGQPLSRTAAQRIPTIPEMRRVAFPYPWNRREPERFARAVKAVTVVAQLGERVSRDDSCTRFRQLLGFSWEEASPYFDAAEKLHLLRYDGDPLDVGGCFTLTVRDMLALQAFDPNRQPLVRPHQREE